jgi:hypothetical protein
MTDFLEITGAETGRRLMINMGLVFFVKEDAAGKAAFWLPKPKEFQTVAPQESYEHIRRTILEGMT